MTISLPYLWVLGHLASPFGAALALADLLKAKRTLVMMGSLGGATSCAFLGWVLHDLGVGFGGLHEYLAWPIAFCAGYLVARPLGRVILILQRVGWRQMFRNERR